MLNYIDVSPYVALRLEGVIPPPQDAASAIYVKDYLIKELVTYVV